MILLFLFISVEIIFPSSKIKLSLVTIPFCEIIVVCVFFDLFAVKFFKVLALYE